jgi:hypothetical protein
MRRPKTTPQRPRFQPLWTAEAGLQTAQERCASDAVDQVGTLLAAAVLSKTPEELIRAAALPEAADGGHPAAVLVDTLAEAVRMTELRLQMLRSAHARVLATACFVNGVDWQ